MQRKNVNLVCIRQPSYMPNIGFFQKLMACDTFVYLDDTQYGSERWDNRNKIRSDKAFMWLTVPIIRKTRNNLNEILIANNENWQKKHLRSIELNYKKTPFFLKYWPEIESILNKKWERLLELNLAIIKLVNSELGIKTKTILSSDLRIKETGSKKLLEICKKVNATSYLSGKMGKSYLDEDFFKESQINIIYDNFLHPTYDQIQGDFLPNMSIIDLLFNMGEESKKLISNSIESIISTKE